MLLCCPTLPCVCVVGKGVENWQMKAAGERLDETYDHSIRKREEDEDEARDEVEVPAKCRRKYVLYEV